MFTCNFHSVTKCAKYYVHNRFIIIYYSNRKIYQNFKILLINLKIFRFHYLYFWNNSFLEGNWSIRFYFFFRREKKVKLILVTKSQEACSALSFIFLRYINIYYLFCDIQIIFNFLDRRRWTLRQGNLLKNH